MKEVIRRNICGNGNKKQDIIHSTVGDRGKVFKNEIEQTNCILLLEILPGIPGLMHTTLEITFEWELRKQLAS